jgi:hypothetical protein
MSEDSKEQHQDQDAGSPFCRIQIGHFIFSCTRTQEPQIIPILPAPATFTRRGTVSNLCAQRDPVFNKQGSGNIRRLAVASATRVRRSAKWDHRPKGKTA